MFLRERPTAKAVAEMEQRQAPPDEFTIDGDEVFVPLTQGAGRSKLRIDLGTPGTARNWRTVLQLLAMM